MISDFMQKNRLSLKLNKLIAMSKMTNIRSIYYIENVKHDIEFFQVYVWVYVWLQKFLNYIGKCIRNNTYITSL